MSNWPTPGKLNCPSCGEPAETGSRFCGSCGSVLTPETDHLVATDRVDAPAEASFAKAEMPGEEQPSVSKWEALKQFERNQKALERSQREGQQGASISEALKQFKRNQRSAASYPLPRSEVRVLRAILVGQLLLLVSLFSPWWRYLGEFIGDDERDPIFSLLVASIFVLVLRFKTPVRPIWLFAAFGVISISGLAWVLNKVGDAEGLSLSIFGYCAVVGILVYVAASVTGFVIALRNDQRMLHSVLAVSKAGDFSVSGEHLKTCPDCAEEVKSAAHVCRFCGFRWKADTAEPATP